MTVEMQFLADVELVCEECKGMSFKSSVLEIRHKGRNIHDVLSLTVREAKGYFSDIARVLSRLHVLDDVSHRRLTVRGAHDVAALAQRS